MLLVLVRFALSSRSSESCSVTVMAPSTLSPMLAATACSQMVLIIVVGRAGVTGGCVGAAMG